MRYVLGRVGRTRQERGIRTRGKRLGLGGYRRNLSLRLSGNRSTVTYSEKNPRAVQNVVVDYRTNLGNSEVVWVVGLGGLEGPAPPLMSLGGSGMEKCGKEVYGRCRNNL